MRRRSKGEDGDRMTPLGFRCCDELLGDTDVMMIKGKGEMGEGGDDTDSGIVID